MSIASDRDEATGIQLLQGDSNFYGWKEAVKNHLKRHDLWEITSGATPRPPGPESDAATATEAQKSWDGGSLIAKCVIRNLLSQEVSRYMYFHETGPAMWTALMERFHRHEPRDLLQSFNAVCSLRYIDDSEESFLDYLDTFHKHWDDLRYRCDDADPPAPGIGNSLETTLKVLANSDQSKSEFLIASLPESMMLAVYGLQAASERNLEYRSVYRWLVGYHARMENLKKEIALEEQIALEEEIALQEAQRVDCIWCRSRGFESEGHEWKWCTLLREFKRQNR